MTTSSSPAASSQDATMTIREMCDAYEVTPRALRFYEAKELIAPIRQGQKRLYTRRDRARLTLILRGKRFGLSLEDIRQLLDLYARDNRNEAQMRRATEVARARLAEMEEQRRALDEAVTELRGELAWIEDELSRLGHSAAAR